MLFFDDDTVNKNHKNHKKVIIESLLEVITTFNYLINNYTDSPFDPEST